MRASRSTDAASDGGESAAVSAAAEPNGTAPQTWKLKLYIAGQTPRSWSRSRTSRRSSTSISTASYEIEVIDLLENPQLAKGDQILAVPTLVKDLPLPVRKIIGDLSNTERVLVGLDLRPA